MVHQAAQSTLLDHLAALIDHILSVLDPTRLQATIPLVAAGVQAVSHQYGQASTSLALAHYANQRKAAGLTGKGWVQPPSVTPVPLDQVTKSVGWALSGLFGPLNTEPVTVDGAVVDPFRARWETARTQLGGVTEKLVADQGRDAVITAVQQDPEAKGWARVAEPGACAFCAMLATRGAVYKKDTADFQSHDHCRCIPEPVFTAYEPPARVREWQQLYHQSQADRSVTSFAAFRKAYDSKYAAK